MARQPSLRPESSESRARHHWSPQARDQFFDPEPRGHDPLPAQSEAVAHCRSVLRERSLRGRSCLTSNECTSYLLDFAEAAAIAGTTPASRAMRVVLIGRTVATGATLLPALTGGSVERIQSHASRRLHRRVQPVLRRARFVWPLDPGMALARPKGPCLLPDCHPLPLARRDHRDSHPMHARVRGASNPPANANSTSIFARWNDRARSLEQLWKLCRPSCRGTARDHRSQWQAGHQPSPLAADGARRSQARRSRRSVHGLGCSPRREGLRRQRRVPPAHRLTHRRSRPSCGDLRR